MQALKLLYLDTFNFRRNNKNCLILITCSHCKIMELDSYIFIVIRIIYIMDGQQLKLLEGKFREL